MRLSTVMTIFKKEMTDTLRDRRTLIFMLLIPIVAIPVLMMGASKLMVSQITKAREEVSKIVIQGEEFLPDELRENFAHASGLEILEMSPEEEKKAKEKLKQGEIQAFVVVPKEFRSQIELEQPTAVEIFYDEAEIKSSFAKEKIEDIFDDFKEKVVLRRLAQRHLPKEMLKPFAVRTENVAPMQKIVGKELGVILPYLIIIMCFMGAMYPAIDLAAGEKERGTLETLLISPATRGEFVIGKYLVVMLTGVVAAFLSLGSLVFSLNYMVEDLVRGMAQMFSFAVNLETVALIFLTIVPLAGIFAGVLLSVSIFARSFKEAQSYVTALNMAVIFPAFVSLLPGIELGYGMSMIPVVNASLIIKEAISGSIEWQYVLVAVGANAVVAVLALLFSRQWFEKESVIFRA